MYSPLQCNRLKHKKMTLVYNTPVQAQAEGGPIQQEGEKRPPGQKKAKEALKRRGGEACMEALDKMWAKKEAFDREKEKKKEERFMAALELEKKKVEADLMEREDKIMSMDMTSSSRPRHNYSTIRLCK